MHSKPNRFAMVVIVECDDPQVARESTLVQMTETANADHQLVHVGDPCPVPVAENYDTDELRLAADGAAVFTCPDEAVESGGFSSSTGSGGEK